MNTFDCVNKDMLKITKYEVLGNLPNPFLFDNGNMVKTKEDWEKRKQEIYKTTIELQYGILPPKPEFLDVETLHVSNNANIVATKH